MRTRSEFQKAGNVLDLSRNYHLLEDRTLSSFPVKVILLPEPLASSSLPPQLTTSPPPESIASPRPYSTTTAPICPQHSAPITTNMQTPSPTSVEITVGAKNAKTAKGKARTFRPRTRKQKQDAGILFKEVVRQIYADPRNPRCLEKASTPEPNKKKKPGWPKGVRRNLTKRKLQEKAIIDEENKKKNRSWPIGMPGNCEKRKLRGEDTNCEQRDKSKRGWPKGVPRNREKRKLWEEAAQTSPHKDNTACSKEIKRDRQQAEQNPQTRKKMRKNDGVPTTAEKMQQREPTPGTVDESETKIENNRTAIIAGLTDVILQMTKITHDIVQLMAMASEEPTPKTGTDRAAIIAGLTDVMLQMTKITQNILRLMAMASGGCENNQY